MQSAMADKNEDGRRTGKDKLMITKRTAYFFMCALITSSLSTNTVCMEEPQKFNPNNTKFAFDFHGVVVTDPFMYLSDLKKALDWNAIPACNRQLPWFLYALSAQAYYGLTGEGFRNLCFQYEQHDLVTCIMDFTNNIALLPDTVAIMKELKEKGYELDLASNIDILFLQDLENNNKYQHIRDALALFTNKKAVDCSNINTVKPIKKPDQRYFDEYQQKHNQEKKQIIFIDDNHNNVLASQEAGMVGIHFQSPQQLRDELVSHGILH
jgi:FMN phosphatase YigB (HAD superfamily)